MVKSRFEESCGEMWREMGPKVSRHGVVGEGRTVVGYSLVNLRGFRSPAGKV